MGKDRYRTMSIDDLKAKKIAEAGEKPQTLREAIDQFNRKEATTVQGAPSRGQKADLLRADEAQEMNPDAHLRWVSPTKAESRIADGYVTVASSEGGKRLGNELILMGIPKQEHERRVAELKAKTDERLYAHVAEFQTAAEAVARELRDRHGLKVSAEDLTRQ